MYAMPVKQMLDGPFGQGENQLKKQSEIYIREISILERLNHVFSDFYDTTNICIKSLNISQIEKLKSALAEVNNYATLKVTIACCEWIFKYFKIDKAEKKEILERISRTKPNTNGYDIEINGKYKIIVEVKAIVPINEGNEYKAAQRNSILDDAIKLKYGKKGKDKNEYSEYIKIIALLDLGEKTNIAIKKILLPYKNPRSLEKIRTDRHEIVPYLELFNVKSKISDLNSEKIYLKSIKVK
jgi:hypothetical protein